MHYVPNLLGIGIFFSSITLGLLALWIAGIVSCAKANMNSNDKLIWLLIIVFFNALGSLLYFIIQPHKKTPLKKTKNKKQEYIKRNTDKAVFGGVCAGLADYWNVDVIALRLLFFVLVFVTGLFPLLLLYLILWLVLEAK